MPPAFKSVFLPHLTSLHNTDSESVLLRNQHNTIIKLLEKSIFINHYFTLYSIKNSAELHCCIVHTPWSLAAMTTFERISSSTNGLTASWIITTSGFWSSWLENSFSANTFSPLKIDRWRVTPPFTIVTLLWPYFSMMDFIVSIFSGETTTIMSDIQLILEETVKKK